MTRQRQQVTKRVYAELAWVSDHIGFGVMCWVREAMMRELSRVVCIWGIMGI